MNLRLPFILLILLAAANPVLAQKPDLLKTETVDIYYYPSLERVARDVADIFPGIQTELQELLGWQIRFKPAIVLMNNREHFRRLAGTDWVVAFAVPRQHLMVIDTVYMSNHPIKLHPTLKHELCHLMLHDHIPSSELPRWLDEGVCQWASDGVAEIIISSNRNILVEAVISGRHIPLTSLNDGFPGNRDGLLLAYEQSKSFIDYLSARHGRQSLLNLLTLLKAGYTLNEAFFEVFSKSFAGLENDWIRHLKKKKSWMTFFIIHMYEIIFFIGALALVAGFVRRTLKKRRYRDEDEEDV